MAGKRLLDAALVLAATRSVARQHLRIRTEQLERWSETSSLAKAVKYQTDRVTVTAAAAVAIAQRLNEDPPDKHSPESSKPPTSAPVPRAESVVADTNASVRDGLEQDHHYERSNHTATQASTPQAKLEIRQEQAVQAPTKDGSIPARGSPIDLTAHNIHAGEECETDQNEDLKAHSRPSPYRSTIEDAKQRQAASIPSQNAIPEQKGPDGINTDIFHSPKIAQMLTGRGKPTKEEYELRLRNARDTPIDNTPPALGHDQDTFNVRQGDAGFANEVREIFDIKSRDNLGKLIREDKDVHNLAADIAMDHEATLQNEATASEPPKPSYQMRASRVPSSRIGRIWQYAGLGSSMAFGAVSETFRRATGNGSDGSLIFSPANIERLVAKLSRMRGAALKLGQIMSFQDSKLLPKPIHDVLQRVQDNADYMPPSQRDTVLASNLGADWRTMFSSFEDVPIAAASIGQVHKAVLASSNTQVAVKIQYPGVATSISSDLSNLSLLLTASRLLPKGLFLDKTIANARTELAWECDYKREGEYQMRFRELLSDETSTFTVPRIFEDACGPQVLTAEFMPGTGVTKDSLSLSQEQKDWIGTQILRLCMRELTEFKLMQTDPNWTNFLFNPTTNKLELLDFGAAREFPSKFIDPYVGILIAASEGDRETIRALSIELDYLTGAESSTMLNAHVDSVLTLAEPFQATRPANDVYDFTHQTVTDRVRGFIPIMVKERLAPPPEETYSLHRKLSGAFLLLTRLGSRVRCRELFIDAIEKWKSGKQNH